VSRKTSGLPARLGEELTAAGIQMQQFTQYEAEKRKWQ
jgi:hypothetical protein